MRYMIDDGIQEVFTDSLTEANKIAGDMKKEHPLRSVYIGKFDEGINGEDYNVIAEA